MSPPASGGGPMSLPAPHKSGGKPASPGDWLPDVLVDWSADVHPESRTAAAIASAIKAISKSWDSLPVCAT
jgi:hypothetical protein